MKNFIEILLYTIIWTLGLIAIYMLILKITNHSPTIDEIQNIIFGVLATIVLAIIIQFSNIYYRLGKIETIQKYMKIDIESIKNDLSYIKKEISTRRSPRTFRS